MGLMDATKALKPLALPCYFLFSELPVPVPEAPVDDPIDCVVDVGAGLW
jgi:hypothetical protein